MVIDCLILSQKVLRSLVACIHLLIWCQILQANIFTVRTPILRRYGRCGKGHTASPFGEMPPVVVGVASAVDERVGDTPVVAGVDPGAESWSKVLN